MMACEGSCGNVFACHLDVQPPILLSEYIFYQGNLMGLLLASIS